ncbi:DUF2339 domain-containing protein [Rufibacter roseus]|uniref:DUF2339 domain-containing protein n=1 Tax=Rufibacter roseus TaxID=1567108 RepID=A0ABW2DDS4_9BACT|nr:DUF2339 domain-containing protein [Rufibacter roseus]
MESALLLFIVLLLAWIGTMLSRQFDSFNGQMEAIREELERLRQSIGKSTASPPREATPLAERRAPNVAAAPASAPPVQTPSPTVTPPPPVVAPAPMTPPAAPASTPVPPKETPAPQAPPQPETAIPRATPPTVPPAAPATPPPPVQPPKEEPIEPLLTTSHRRMAALQESTATAPVSVLEEEEKVKEPKDWEKFIGENLINKLGIVILVLGIGFFVKFAIDKDWISEIGRVAIGLLAGGALLGVAHRLRLQYSAFSSVLVGGGMAVLYFTIAIAFHEYQLFGQTVAFLLMVAITGFTIFLSIAYDRLELAVVALIGGFGSPFMVSTGEGNYVVLFVFILILNLGILVLAYYKKWPLLNFIAYFFTIVLYGGWLMTRVVDTPSPPYVGALVFATLFYLVFFLMNIIYNVKERQAFNAREMVSLLSNSAMYYAAGMYILANVDGGAYQGLFTLGLAIFNFGFAYTLYRSQRADRNLVYLLIGLVLTFLSLTAPVQLEGNHITLFWALESVVLLWLAQRAGLPIIKVASCLVLGLMLVSLFMDWFGYTSAPEEPLRFLLNRYFLTGLFSLTALAAVWILLGRDEKNYPEESSWHFYRTGVGVLGVIFLYLVFLLEFVYQLQHTTWSEPVRVILLSFYHYLFLLGLLWRSLSLSSYVLRQIPLTFAAVGLLVYFVVVHPATVEIRDAILIGKETSSEAFLLHYLPLATVLAIAGMMLRLVYHHFGFNQGAGKAALWIASLVAIFLVSAELEHLWALAVYERGNELELTLRQVRKIGWPILWGICSFMLMMLGMRHKLKTLRIISLTVFFVTLAKLFLIDVWDMSEGGKIAAFICLGMLLLIVSFLYQKLKNLILVDDRSAHVSSPDA